MLNSSSASPHLHCTSLLPRAGFDSWWYTGLTPELLRWTHHAVNGFFTLWLVDLWLMVHWPEEHFLDQESSGLKIWPATGTWTPQQETHGQFFTHVARGCYKVCSLYHGACPWLLGGLLGNSVWWGRVGKPGNPWFYQPDTGSCREIGMRPAGPLWPQGPAGLIPISLQNPLLALWTARGIWQLPTYKLKSWSSQSPPLTVHLKDTKVGTK